MSGGIYELYRLSLNSYYETVQVNKNSSLFINMKSIKDKRGMIVETQIKFSQKKGEKSGVTRKTNKHLMTEKRRKTPKTKSRKTTNI